MRGATKCDVCGEAPIRFKYSYKINGERMCKQCYKQNKRANRNILKSIKIMGKYADRQTNSKLSLDWSERRILYNCLVKSGLDEDEAKKRVKNLKDYERKLFLQIKRETTSREELNERFKKEFKKLIEK